MIVKKMNATQTMEKLAAASATDSIDPSVCNGALFAQDTAVYFVLEGKACHVPNPETYNNLFRNWDVIGGKNISASLKPLWDAMISQIPKGPEMTNGALLIKGDASDAVYLLTNGVKHWISSPAVMDYCAFEWKKVKLLPLVVVEAIPSGSTIDYGSKQ